MAKLEAERTMLVMDGTGISLCEELEVVLLTTLPLPVDPVGVAVLVSAVVGVEWCLGQISLSSASLTISAGFCNPMKFHTFNR